jgi:phage tail sheath protein FI
MPTYSTPGVYIEEIPSLPPSVAAVATAVPAFIGYTEKSQDATGNDLHKVRTRITSVLEFEALFGRAPLQAMSVAVDKRVSATDGSLIGISVAFDTALPAIPTQLMHYSIRHYFANGGGPCYIYSVGPHGAATQVDFTDAISDLESVDEPTLLVFPEAVRLPNDGAHGAVVVAALQSCNKTQDRFTIADVRNALPGGTDTAALVDTNFRTNVSATSVDLLKYGAAYFPYLKTNIPWHTDDTSVTLSDFNEISVAADGTPTPTDHAAEGNTLADATIKDNETAVYNAVKAFISQAYVTLPPSAAAAGVYARVDRTRGVHKAPANVGVLQTVGPAVRITNDLQDALNIDATSGKSVNAIRAFAGKGTLVWGARTLAGNDNEYRYVPVRRFLNFVEESIGKAVAGFVFEPNDANTWVKVRSMIENFLTLQWRDGALVGAKQGHAFGVAVGINQTMTAQDILEGYMRVRVQLAIVRPAEFIVLEFAQKMQES